MKVNVLSETPLAPRGATAHKRRLEANGYRQTSIFLKEDDRQFLLDIKEKHGAKNQSEAIALLVEWVREGTLPPPGSSVPEPKPTK